MSRSLPVWIRLCTEVIARTLVQGGMQLGQPNAQHIYGKRDCVEGDIVLKRLLLRSNSFIRAAQRIIKKLGDMQTLYEQKESANKARKPTAIPGEPEDFSLRIRGFIEAHLMA